ncbi:helix-turn-helix transcriptional regulator [Mycoplasmatota bacterium]|nr:helix-turn-helix transcriptional regulator [Mycoplasmatota bacterium]
MFVNKNIKTLREREGLTQVELAKRIGVSDRTIQKYESSKILDYKLTTLIIFKELFNVSLDDLVFKDLTK